MPSTQENTKIEQLAEAIESVCIANIDRLIINPRTHPAMDKTPEMIALNCADARHDLAEALREFLKPSLRIAEKIRQVGEAREEIRVATLNR